jgi:hypothetical protein
VHTIETADESRLTATRRTNQRRGVIRCHIEVDVIQSLAFAVPGIQIVDLDSNARKLCRSESTTAHDVAHSCNRRHDENDQHQRSRPGVAQPFIGG